jgi:hypothetical protein
VRAALVHVLVVPRANAGVSQPLGETTPVGKELHRFDD